MKSKAVKTGLKPPSHKRLWVIGYLKQIAILTDSSLTSGALGKLVGYIFWNASCPPQDANLGPMKSKVRIFGVPKNDIFFGTAIVILVVTSKHPKGFGEHFGAHQVAFLQ